MQLRKVTAVVLVAVLLAGCEKATTIEPKASVAPSASPKTLEEKTDAALRGYGYLPVLVDGSKPPAHIYLYCEGRQIPVCAAARYDLATNEHPNFVVVSGKITTLEGPHPDGSPKENYFVSNLPGDYPKFGDLSTEQQQQLLSIMSEAIIKYDAKNIVPGVNFKFEVMVVIGKIKVNRRQQPPIKK